ncbi:hypothetical protein [Methylobacterium oryzisoli]|uniref:hypothetical protein n=1 Tax=Methylobacterium oryzisoli TaxID=3385502 RepID=UPI00389190FA
MSLIHNEQTKLTAGYLNAGASAFLAAGVVAPIAAAVFGVTGPGGPVPTLTIVIGVSMFLVGSILLHLAARYLLRSLRP